MASKDANEQTFYMTNMMPQGDLFNGKLWAAMEAFVRNWGKKCTGTDTLFVVKGGTIDKESQILCRTRNGFIVPRYFFMALLSKRNGIYQAMGFRVEHINSDHSSDPLINYACNIRTLEEKTGIDFFCNLHDDLESTVETQNMTVIKRLWNL
jgi:endonuclease G